MAGRIRSLKAGAGDGGMQSFDDKHPAEFIEVSVDFSPVLDDGVTLSSALVGATVYTHSPSDDGSPAGLLDGACTVNSATYTPKNGDPIPASCGVIQELQAGLDQAIYVLTFFATASDGEELIESVVIFVNAYAPAPTPPSGHGGIGEFVIGETPIGGT